MLVLDYIKNYTFPSLKLYIIMSDINEIFDLYIKNGDNDYIGENVSQIEHALQAALLAENQSYPDHVILASFLHDIGIYCKTYFNIRFLTKTKKL